jgi:gamma-glutamylcyclotransferase (GGCT)/AIG2-like uncharacterized protein YtfP
MDLTLVIACMYVFLETKEEYEPRLYFCLRNIKTKFFQPLFALSIQRNANFVGEGTIPGILFTLDWYPGAIYEPAHQTTVFGEVFELKNADLFPELDAYEGVTGNDTDEYEKIKVPVRCNEKVYHCWFYQYRWDVPSDKILTSGKF